MDKPAEELIPCCTDAITMSMWRYILTTMRVQLHCSGPTGKVSRMRVEGRAFIVGLEKSRMSDKTIARPAVCQLVIKASERAHERGRSQGRYNRNNPPPSVPPLAISIRPRTPLRSCSAAIRAAKYSPSPVLPLCESMPCT